MLADRVQRIAHPLRLGAAIRPAARCRPAWPLHNTSTNNRGSRFAPPQTPPCPPKASAFGQQPLRSHQQRRAGIRPDHLGRLPKVTQIAGAVLQADDVRQGQRVPQRVQFELDLRMAGHVVQEHRQRHLDHDVFEVFQQFRLAGRKIVGRGQHDGRSSLVRRDPRQVDRFHKGGVRDADQDGHTTVYLAADALDQLTTQAVAQAGAFARRAQNEQAVNAASQDVFDQPFEPGQVQRVAVLQRGHHRRDDAAQRAGERSFGHRVTTRFQGTGVRRTEFNFRGLSSAIWKTVSPRKLNSVRLTRLITFSRPDWFG